MSDFQNSTHKCQTPHERLETGPIVKDQPGSCITESAKLKSAPVAAVIIWFKKVLAAFTAKSRPSSMASEQKQLVEDLLAFKKMLQILAVEDQSHNPEFTQQFSELWHSLMDDCNHLEPFEVENCFQLNQIKLLINRMHLFPIGETLNLGHYLTKFADFEWLPLPFMDILHKLHQDYLEDSEASHLGAWIREIESLLSSQELPFDLSSLSC